MYLVGAIQAVATSLDGETQTRQNISLNLNILSMATSSCNGSRHDGSNLIVNSNLIEFRSIFSSSHNFETKSLCDMRANNNAFNPTTLIFKPTNTRNQLTTFMNVTEHVSFHLLNYIKICYKINNNKSNQGLCMNIRFLCIKDHLVIIMMLD